MSLALGRFVEQLLTAAVGLNLYGPPRVFEERC
jgi:hypothetical protein